MQQRDTPCACSGPSATQYTPHTSQHRHAHARARLPRNTHRTRPSTGMRMLGPVCHAIHTAHVPAPACVLGLPVRPNPAMCCAIAPVMPHILVRLWFPR
eukprot:363628-Chlamydomonas_euryale.AAC.6